MEKYIDDFTVGVDVEAVIFSTKTLYKLDASEYVKSRKGEHGFDHHGIAEVHPKYRKLTMNNCIALEEKVKKLLWEYGDNIYPVYSYPSYPTGAHIHYGMYAIEEGISITSPLRSQCFNFVNLTSKYLKKIQMLNSEFRRDSEYASMTGFRLYHENHNTFEIRCIPTGVFLYEGLYAFLMYSLGYAFYAYMFGKRKCSISILNIVSNVLDKTIIHNLNNKIVAPFLPLVSLVSSIFFEHPDGLKPRHIKTPAIPIGKKIEFRVPENFNINYIYNECWLVPRKVRLERYYKLVDNVLKKAH